MKLLLADDHPLFREGIKPLLRKLDAVVEVIEAQDYPSAFAAMRAAGEVDLALIDLYMPGMRGREGIAQFRAAYPDVPLVILSASEQPDDIQHLLDAGALGYITKSSPGEVIMNALRLVLSGGLYIPPRLLGGQATADVDGETGDGAAIALTERQRAVLQQLALGKSNRQIAAALHVTEGTVKVHLAGIFRVLKVSSRTEALLAAQRLGLIAAAGDTGPLV